jgi:hypothetical protein
MKRFSAGGTGCLTLQLTGVCNAGCADAAKREVATFPESRERVVGLGLPGAQFSGSGDGAARRQGDPMGRP